jgi:hypothetical protein
MAVVESGRWEAVEITLGATVDPSGKLTVDVTTPADEVMAVPAFWSPTRGWAFRYSSGVAGSHTYRVQNSTSAIDQGEIRVSGIAAPEAVAPIRLAADGRHLESADGVPFLWLADTCWNGFSARRISDDDFRRIMAQRAAQGFNVVQLAVLPPGEPPLDEATTNRAGRAWDPLPTHLNHEWWDEADGRIRALVEVGLVPCVYAAWGRFYDDLGAEAMTRHWHEMIARWGAYPVVWCLAGEISLPTPEMMAEAEAELAAGGNLAPTGEDFERAMAPALERRVRTFNLVAQRVRELDPYRRLVTLHTLPGQMPWEVLDDEDTVDLWMFQTGHGYRNIAPAMDAVLAALDHAPAKPVINGEPSYEGVIGGSWSDVQRFLFWSHMLSGAAGHCYGADGVWQLGTSEFPGSVLTPESVWETSIDYAGARHIGKGAAWLARHDWTSITSTPSALAPHASADDRLAPYAAELADGSRIVYLPAGGIARLDDHSPTLLGLDERERWSLRYVNPRTLEELAPTTIENTDRHRLRDRPTFEDWLVVLSPIGPTRAAE